MSEETMNENNEQKEVHSNAVKAGKRTYFFDVKTTKNNDLYLVITESKKVFNNGRKSFKKHKIFLYKEDFMKFKDALAESLDKICELKSSSGIYEDADYDIETSTSSEVNFDDL